jgi:hypothetical protein
MQQGHLFLCYELAFSCGLGNIVQVLTSVGKKGCRGWLAGKLFQLSLMNVLVMDLNAHYII